MSTADADDSLERSELRERHRSTSSTSQARYASADARRKVLELNQAEEDSNKDEKDKRTYGRTPNGTGKC